MKPKNLITMELQNFSTREQKRFLHCGDKTISAWMNFLLNIKRHTLKSCCIYIWFSICFLLISTIAYGNDLNRVNGKSLILVGADRDTGSTTIFLQNTTKTPLLYLLSSGNIINYSTNKLIPSDILFYNDSSRRYQPQLTVSVNPNSISPVRLKINGFKNSNEAYAVINDHTSILDTIAIYKSGISFNISQDFVDQTDPKIKLRRKVSNIAILKNEDAVDYLVAWSIIIPDLNYISESEQVLCPAQSTKPIEIKIPSSYFTQFFTGFFKDQEIPAQIKFEYISKSKIDFVAPVKTISLKAVLQYYSDTNKSVFSYLIILFVISLGALASLSINLWIPNKLKKLNLKRNLDQLRRKVSSLSLEIDSSLRVYLGVERLSLIGKIEDVKIYNPDSKLILAELEKEIKILQNRIETIQQLDNAYRSISELDGKSFHAPPSMIRDINDKLKVASDLLKIPIPEDDSFKVSKDIIRLANIKLKNFADAQLLADDDFAIRLAGSIVELRDNFAYFIFEFLDNNKLKKIIKDPEIKTNLKTIAEELIKLQNTEAVNTTPFKKFKDLYAENKECKKQVHKLLSENKQLFKLLKKDSELSPRNEVYLDICEEAFELLGTIYSFKPDFSIKDNINPRDYHYLSSAVERLDASVHVIRSWKLEEENSKKQDTGNSSSKSEPVTLLGDKNIYRKQAKTKFIELLKDKTWNGLQRLRQIRDEIEGDIFDDEIKSALKNRNFTISYYPINPAPNQIVQMEVRLNEKRLDSSSAKNNFACIWDFNEIEVGNEEGWKITHYFKPLDIKDEVKRRFRGHVEFKDEDGKVIMQDDPGTENNDSNIDAQANKNIIKKRIEIDLRTPKKEGFFQRNQRNFLEMIKLSFIIFIAILGLIAGAKEQLEKLDILPAMVAVFLIGYAADSIKKYFGNDSTG